MRQWLLDRAAWIDAQFMRPPQITPSGGPVPSGTTVTLTSGSGEVYYTLDGTDPRVWSPAGGRASGDVSPSAIRYSPGLPIVLQQSLVLKARTLDRRNTYNPWSGLAKASYRVDAWQSSLRITELMYHPVDPDPCDAIAQEAYEYVR